MYYADCTCIGRMERKKTLSLKLEIRNLSMRNWYRWSHDIMRAMHRVFPSGLWWSERNFTESLKDGEYIARIATMEGRFVGCTVGIYDKVPDKTLGTTRRQTRVMHLYYIFLDTPYLHLGYGLILLRDFIEMSKAQGYQKITAFAKTGASVKNLQKLGGQRLKVFEDFYETGETYIFCVMDLRSYRKS